MSYIEWYFIMLTTLSARPNGHYHVYYEHIRFVIGSDEIVKEPLCKSDVEGVTF